MLFHTEISQFYSTGAVDETEKNITQIIGGFVGEELLWLNFKESEEFSQAGRGRCKANTSRVPRSSEPHSPVRKLTSKK